MFARVVGLIAVTGVLAACSAGEFKKPIEAFATATKAAASSLAEHEATLDKLALDNNIEFAVAHQGSVDREAGDCRRGAKRCRLVLRTDRNTRVPLVPSPVDSNIRKLMSALAGYATNLNAIATADTAGEIKGATDGTKTSIIALAKAGDALNAQTGNRLAPLEPTVSKYAGPATDLATFLLTAYAEHVKVKALRESTATVDEIFPSLTILFSAVADAGLTVKRNQLRADFDKAYLSYRTAQDREKLVVLQAKAMALDAALAVNPSATFVALHKAHAALTAELSLSDPDFEQVWKYLQQVGNEVAKLVALVQAVQKSRRE